MSLNGSDQDPWSKPKQDGSPQQKTAEQKSAANERQQNAHQSDENAQSAHQQNQQNNQPRDEQSPPDLEEVFNNLLKKLGGNKTNNNHSNNGNGNFKFGKLLPLAGAAALLLWGVSGFYTIKEAERGVVLRLGQLHSVVQPGLNWKPTFIDRVVPVNVEQVQELKTQGSMLTQDENMVKVEMTVQYRVQDPAQYLFNVVNPNDSLNQATDSALRYTIGHMTMNDILTTGRSWCVKILGKRSIKLLIRTKWA